MLFSQAKRSKPVLYEIIELVDVEASGFTLKRRQRPDDLGNFGSVCTNAELFCFMPEYNQLNSEFCETCVARLTQRHGLPKLCHPESLCEGTDIRIRVQLGLRKLAVINLADDASPYCAVIRALDKIKNERNCENGDDDHQ